MYEVLGGWGGGGSKDFFFNLFIKNEILRSCIFIFFWGYGKFLSNCIMIKV